MFDWDRHNLRKIRAHKVTPEEAEQALLNDPIPMHEQAAEGETRFVYYGETNVGRLLGVAATQRKGRIRVVTAYDLSARQRRTYFKRRFLGE